MTRPAHRFSLISLAAVLLVSAPVLAQSDPAPLEAEGEAEAPAAATKGEQELAKLLKGRVAGEPMQCIRNLPNEQMRTIDGTAYVFGRGDTIYVQRTLNPEAISQRNALAANRFSGTQLCRMDVLTTFDRVIGFFTGSVSMDDFIPYTRTRRND